MVKVLWYVFWYHHNFTTNDWKGQEQALEPNKKTLNIFILNNYVDIKL
jgi:hypothetical protein